MQPRVFVTNVFPDGNKGGAAITGGTIEAIQRAAPDSQITLVTTQVTNDRFEQSHRFTTKRFPNVHLTMPLIPLGNGPFAGLRGVLASLVLLLRNPRNSSHCVIRQLANAQLVVSKGGYVFVERYTIRRLLSNWLTVFPLVLAAKAGAKTAAIGATIGPFETWHSRALNGWVLRRLDLVVARDEYSYREALSLGLDPKRVVRLPDLVLAHRGPPDACCSSVAARYCLEGSRTCMVTLAEGPGDATFLPRLQGCLRRLLDEGVVDKVVVVVQSLQDLDVSRNFVAAFRDERCVLIQDDLGPEELMAVYASATFVIARRMHGAIFALIAASPTFAFTQYGKKVQGVMQALDLEEYVVSYPRFEADDLHDRIVATVNASAATRKRVRTAVENARVELGRLSPLLRELMFPQAADPLGTNGSAAAHGR